MDRIYKYNPNVSYEPNGERYLQLITAKDLYIRNITVAEHNSSHSDGFQVKFPNVFTNYPLGAVSYLDLTFIIESNNRLYTNLYDKRDDFDFHIVNFPFLSSNIPSSPSYGVYISQLIGYARCCSYYDDFGYRHKLFASLLSYLHSLRIRITIILVQQIGTGNCFFNVRTNMTPHITSVLTKKFCLSLSSAKKYSISSTLLNWKDQTESKYSSSDGVQSSAGFLYSSLSLLFTWSSSFLIILAQATGRNTVPLMSFLFFCSHSSAFITPAFTAARAAGISDSLLLKS